MVVVCLFLLTRGENGVCARMMMTVLAQGCNSSVDTWFGEEKYKCFFKGEKNLRS